MRYRRGTPFTAQVELEMPPIVADTRDLGVGIRHESQSCFVARNRRSASSKAVNASKINLCNA